MTMPRIILLLILLSLLTPPGAAWADSLYCPAQPGAEDQSVSGLYSPHPPMLAIGDVIRVRVRERSIADVELSVQSKSSDKNDTSLTRSGGILGRLISPLYKLLGEGKLGFNNTSDFKDDGTNGREVRVDAMVTALVVDKLDNGNLVIEGRKRVLVNREEQTLVVRGVVNPADLDWERTVESDMIADVEMEYIGVGQLSKKARPGFISRILSSVF